MATAGCDGTARARLTGPARGYPAATTRDCLRDDRSRFLLHHANKGFVAAFFAEAIEAQAVVERTNTTESQSRYLVEIMWFFKKHPFLKNPIVSTTSSNC